MTDKTFPALSLTETCSLIKAANRPVILTHRAPDGDTVGSAMALWELFRLMGKDADIACADVIPERLSFLMTDYTPTGEDIGAAGRTVIAVDVASPAQLGNLSSVFCGELAPALMIDHHGTGTPFAPYYTLSEASSAGEVVYNVAVALLSEGVLPCLSQVLVDSLYAAISSDTGCFRFANNSPVTMRIAASLMERGASYADINRLLFDTKSAAALRAEAFVASRIETYADGRIAICRIGTEELAADRVSMEDMETAIDIVRSLRGAEIACTLKEVSREGERAIRVSLRAVSADVAAVCAAFGGGGHTRAAGCTLPGVDTVGARELLLPHLIKAL